MKRKEPTSFIIFAIVFSVTALVFSAATVLSYYHADKKYAMLLACILLVAFAFSAVGIYAGIKYKTEVQKFKRLNQIGLIGNLVVFLFTVGIMLTAALMK